MGAKKKKPRKKAKSSAERRTGGRIFIPVPLTVRGKIRGRSFKEDTHTLRVNAGGGLLTLAAHVRRGQKVRVVNRVTQEEQECRVAFVGPQQPRRRQVGVALGHPGLEFWRRHAKEEKVASERRGGKRIFVPIPLLVRGKHEGKPFKEETHTIRVNENGGLITLATPVEDGQELVVQNKLTGEEMECRVVYLGSTQARKAEVGVRLVAPAPSFWERPSVDSRTGVR